MRWTSEQLNTLVSGYGQGLSYRTLSRNTRHSISSVHDKAFSMGLKRKWQMLEELGPLGHLDIEASQLTANFGFMLSWAIKIDNGTILHDQLNRKDFSQADKIDTDKRIVRSLSLAIQEFDVITHFFGDYFDIPFVRSRCLKHGIQFPEYGSVFTVDVWKWSKRNLKLHSTRLESVAQHLGVNTKTKLDPNTWIRASMGDIKSIEKIAYHNEQDVRTLEKVYHKLKLFSSGARRSI